LLFFEFRLKFRMAFRFLNGRRGRKLDAIKMKNAARQTLKENPFSPLYVCRRGVCFPLNLRAVAGKRYGRAFGKNLEVTQAPAAPKYPLASLRRADLKELTSVKLSGYGRRRLPRSS
jgi:hypothetical protein